MIEALLLGGEVAADQPIVPDIFDNNLRMGLLYGARSAENWSRGLSRIADLQVAEEFFGFLSRRLLTVRLPSLVFRTDHEKLNLDGVNLLYTAWTPPLHLLAVTERRDISLLTAVSTQTGDTLYNTEGAICFVAVEEPLQVPGPYRAVLLLPIGDDAWRDHPLRMTHSVRDKLFAAARESLPV